jgi:hypothetical protein
VELTRNDISMVAALNRWGLVDGGSVPWLGWPTPRPESIVEPGACSGGAGRVGRRPEAAATGRTSVVDDETSATPRYAVASSRMKLRLTARSAQEYGDLMTLDPAARRQ